MRSGAHGSLSSRFPSTSSLMGTCTFANGFSATCCRRSSLLRRCHIGASSVPDTEAWKLPFFMVMYV